MSKNIVKRITTFNKDRDPKLLKLKYEALKESPFRFFRGTCHIFYEDMPKKSFILQSPRAWICGDLHLENFGSFKGENRLAYFDMNDFDESLLGPCLLDVVRLCTSIFLAAGMIKAGKPECRRAATTFIRSYADTLKAGRIRFIEKETAKGVVGDFLSTVALRKRKDLLTRRVDFAGNGPVIMLQDLKVFKVGKKTKLRVKEAVESWAIKCVSNPEFYKVLDVAKRAIGTGSLGIERYLALVNGKGKSDGHYLLDLKEALFPSPLHYLKFKQPKWKNEAARLIEIQSRVQAASPAYLHSIKIGKNWFVMKELQPFEDKIDFIALKNDLPKLIQLLHDMVLIVAWNNFRSSGRQGSAIADEMINFGRKMDKLEPLIIEYAENYAQKVVSYWKEFLKYDPVHAMHLSKK